MEFKENMDRLPSGIKRLRNRKVFLYIVDEDGIRILDKLISYGIFVSGILYSHRLPMTDIVLRAKVFVTHIFDNIKKSKPYNIPQYDYESVRAELKDAVIVCGFSSAYKSTFERLMNDNMVFELVVLEGADYLYANDFRFLDNSKVTMIDNYFETINKRGLDYAYFVRNRELFEQTYEWLEDDKSRETMEKYLSGHIELKEFPLVSVWHPEDVKNQYFDKELIRFSEQEIFVDCGAFTGDTLENFNNRVESFKCYYAWEPDSRRFKELHANMRKAKGEVRHIELGGWDKKARLAFSFKNHCGEIVELFDEKNNESVDNVVDVDSIDNVLGIEERVTFIKMDIEGSELKALVGARQVIQKWHPTLAICAYHKKEDLITIPQYIKELDADYKLYLRAYHPYCSELVLYAI